MENPDSYRDVISFVDINKLLDFTGFKSGFDINDLTTFEDNNKLTVNIYEYEEECKNVCPI